MFSFFRDLFFKIQYNISRVGVWAQRNKSEYDAQIKDKMKQIKEIWRK
jgi:hypothetical protein